MSWLPKPNANDAVVEIEFGARSFIADVTSTRPHVLLNPLPSTDRGEGQSTEQWGLLRKLVCTVIFLEEYSCICL